jgi:hypothetical protein
MVTISGKAPIVADEDNAASAAAQAAAVAAASAAAAGTTTSSSNKLPPGGVASRIGQALGIVGKDNDGNERNEVPGRQWRPVWHPAFTIAGTQPTVLLPQVGSKSPFSEGSCECFLLSPTQLGTAQLDLTKGMRWVKAAVHAAPRSPMTYIITIFLLDAPLVRSLEIFCPSALLLEAQSCQGSARVHMPTGQEHQLGWQQ